LALLEADPVPYQSLVEIVKILSAIWGIWGENFLPPTTVMYCLGGPGLNGSGPGQEEIQNKTKEQTGLLGGGMRVLGWQ